MKQVKQDTSPKSESVLRGPLHPGELIRRRFFEPLKIPQVEFCKTYGINETKFSRLLNGKVPITAETANELSEAFGMSPMFFMNLQSRYSLEMVKRDSGSDSQ